MATIRRFEEIEAWKLAREICKVIGDMIDTGRFKRNYRFIVQVEGSSGSIMDNIAEGFERGTKSEFIQFLGYAKGSSGELRSQTYRALDRKYITQSEFDDLSTKLKRVSAMIQKMIEYLQKSQLQGLRKKTTLKP
jgi:four helix bundle protein